MSHALLSSLDSLSHPVADSSASSLLVREALGGYRAAEADEVLIAAQQLLAQRVRGTDVLSSPEAVREFLRARLSALDHEVFALLHLDAQHGVLDYVELFRGTLTQTSVYPREVVKDVLRLNSAAVVLVHSVARHRMHLMFPELLCAMPLRRLRRPTSRQHYRPHKQTCPLASPSTTLMPTGGCLKYKPQRTPSLVRRSVLYILIDASSDHLREWKLCPGSTEQWCDTQRWGRQGWGLSGSKLKLSSRSTAGARSTRSGLQEQLVAAPPALGRDESSRRDCEAGGRRRRSLSVQDDAAHRRGAGGCRDAGDFCLKMPPARTQGGPQ
jgi:DNA repair protein RadC